MRNTDLEQILNLAGIHGSHVFTRCNINNYNRVIKGLYIGVEFLTGKERITCMIKFFNKLVTSRLSDGIGSFSAFIGNVVSHLKSG